MKKNAVKNLFDFQKFNVNQHLADMIEKTESKYTKTLSDDDLAHISAAGNLNTSIRFPKKTEGK